MILRGLKVNNAAPWPRSATCPTTFKIPVWVRLLNLALGLHLPKGASCLPRCDLSQSTFFLFIDFITSLDLYLRQPAASGMTALGQALLSAEKLLNANPNSVGLRTRGLL